MLGLPISVIVSPLPHLPLFLQRIDQMLLLLSGAEQEQQLVTSCAVALAVSFCRWDSSLLQYF